MIESRASESNPEQLANLASSSLSSRREWQAVFLLAVIQFCHILDFVLMMPLGPAIMKQLNITTHSFGFLVSSYSFAAAAMGFVTSLFIDKFERRTALLFLFCGFAGATAACGLTNSYAVLLLFRICAGCFGGVVNACVFAIAGELVAPQRRGQAMGVLMAAFSVSSVLGIPIGLSLSEKYFWNSPFLVLGIFSIVVAASIPVVLPKMNEHAVQRKLSLVQEIITITKYPGHFRSFLLISFLVSSAFCIIPYLATYLVHNLGMSTSELSLMYMCGGIGTIVSSQIIGRLTDRLGTIQTLFLVTAIAWIPLLLVVHSHKQELSTTLIMMTAFTMFVSGRAVPTMAIVTTVSDPSHRGGFMSLFSSVQACALGLASAVGGFILTENADGSFERFPELGYLSVALSFIMLLIAYSMKKLLLPPKKQM